MKNLKNTSLIRSIALLALIYATNVIPMRISEHGEKAAKSYWMQQQQKRKNQYFIHEQDDKSKGVWVDKALAKSCSTLKYMIEAYGEDIEEIPLNWPIDQIKLVFNVLGNKINIDSLSLENLIIVANKFNYLDAPADKLNTILMKIKNNVLDKNNKENLYTQLKDLHIDLLATLMPNSLTDQLKDNIIKKYVQSRKTELIGHPNVNTFVHNVTAVTFSPNGQYIVSGCDGYKNNLILWDAKTQKKIKVILNNDKVSKEIKQIIFYPDSKRFILLHDMNLTLWNIYDINNIKSQILDKDIVSFAISRNSNILAMENLDNNIILRDINNPDKIIKTLVDHPKNYHSISISFSSDNKYLISSSGDKNKNLLLWDITNLENIISYDLSNKLAEFGSSSAMKIAFHPYDKKFISCDNNKLIIWDISNPNNIYGKIFDYHEFNIKPTLGGRLFVYSLEFSNDGKRFAVGHNNGFTLLDINNPSNYVTVDKIGPVFALAFSPDDKQIITGHHLDQPTGNLIVWTLLTDQEEKLLNDLKNYNANQIRLLYSFCLQELKRQSVSLKSGSEEEQVFKTLPEDMQKLLQDLFFYQGWFSGWW